jgi:hypothetical protein
MRNKLSDGTPWAVEAARRREVIESDYGAPRRAVPDVTDTPDGEHSTALVASLGSWLAGMTRTLRVGSSEPVECLPHGQPGIGAPKAGT